MKILSRIVTCVLIFCITLTTIVNASITGVRLVNNTSPNSDYKLTQSQGKEIASAIKTDSEEKETFTGNSGKNKTGNQALDYLIENNIISREHKIKFSKKGIEIIQDKNKEITFNRTDFLMGLYKATEGILNSRPFVFNVKSKRIIDGQEQVLTGDVDNYRPGETLSFNEGDYEIYVSPNVQELYLVELLKKGIIQENEIKDIKFLEEYKQVIQDSIGMLPEWDNSLQPYYYDSSKTELNNQLGKAWEIKGFFRLFDSKTKNFYMERKDTSFLVDESLTKLQALRYVNSFINPNNETYDKSKYDEIAYLYGNKEILSLDEKDRDIVLYLLTQGILDRDNLNEVADLNQPINNEFVYNLYYRIYNPEHRVQIQLQELTDGDRQLMKDGFIRNTLSVYDEIDSKIEPQTLSVEKVEQDNFMGIIKSNYTPTFADPNANEEEDEGGIQNIGDDLTGDRVDETIKSEKADYKIRKLFPAPDRVEYSGKKISDLSASNEVMEVSDDGKGKIVTFKVKASSDIEALAIIDSKLTYDLQQSTTNRLQTVTQVTSDSKTTNYISAREIERSLGELMVMSTKVLKNRTTGTMAVLLEDNNTAMVGNKVIKTSQPIVIDNTADTYYNLEVVVNLMSNAYLSEIDPGKMFIVEDLPKERIVDVTGTGGVIERTTVMSNSAVKQGFFSKSSEYYNLNLMSRGVTTLTRDFMVNNKKVSVVVDWSYSLPDNDRTIIDLFNDPNFSVKKASEFLFTRPTGETLQSWWDNNIHLSNALANLLYGTTGVNYITSGYLKPDLTLLMHDEGIDEKTALTSIFSGLELPANYVKDYMDNDRKDFQEKLFSGTGDVTKRRIYSCIKPKNVEDCKVYDNMYIISPTGSIYKNIDQDKRVKFEDNQLKVTGRDSLSEDEVSYKTEVMLGDKKYYLQELRTSVDKYYKLTATEATMGKFRVDSTGKTTFVGANGNDILREELNQLVKDVGLKAGEFKPIVDYSVQELSSIPNPKLMSNGLYYINGEAKSFDPSSDDMLREPWQPDINGSQGLAFKNIYLDRMKFTVENGQIVRRKTNPYLEQGNVFFSGLNSTLISRLIDNQADTIKYSEIPMGSQVVIQDYTFRKTSKGLESAPIKDQSLTNDVLNSLGNQESMNRSILARFTGLQILYSGRPVSFSSYIKTTDMGSLQIGDEIVNAVYKNNGEIMMANGDTRQKYTSGAESVCIMIQPDENLNFYLLDDSTKTYAIKYTTDEYSEGYIDNVSIFNEDLGLGIADDIFLELKDNIFKPMEGFRDVMEQYKQTYNSALKGDIIAIIQSILTTILLMMILCIFICTMILKSNGSILNILLALRGTPKAGHSRQFDIISIMSFGLWNLDSNPSVALVALGELGLFILTYIVVNGGTVIKLMFY